MLYAWNGMPVAVWQMHSQKFHTRCHFSKPCRATYWLCDFLHKSGIHSWTVSHRLLIQFVSFTYVFCAYRGCAIRFWSIRLWESLWAESDLAGHAHQWWITTLVWNHIKSSFVFGRPDYAGDVGMFESHWAAKQQMQHNHWMVSESAKPKVRINI